MGIHENTMRPNRKWQHARWRSINLNWIMCPFISMCNSELAIATPCISNVSSWWITRRIMNILHDGGFSCIHGAYIITQRLKSVEYWHTTSDSLRVSTNETPVSLDRAPSSAPVSENSIVWFHFQSSLRCIIHCAPLVSNKASLYRKRCMIEPYCY